MTEPGVSPRVLVIASPEKTWAKGAAELLAAEGIESVVEDLEAAIEAVPRTVFLLALCGPVGEAWSAVVSRLREAAPALPVVLAGPAGDVRQAVLALRAQPFDYLELPIAVSRLRETLARVAWEPNPQQAHWLESLSVLTPGLIHELRNPLSGVLAGSQLLGRVLSAASGPSVEYSEIVREEAQHLERHLTRLAEFGRLGSQAWGPSAELDLSELVRGVLDRHRPDWQTRGVQVTLANARDASVVRGDAGRLGQAVGELFRNALDAVPDGGTVSCHVRAVAPGPPTCTARRIEIRLSDSGPGLSAEARRRAFEPFFSTKPRALGIGLPLAQLIAVRHGGVVRLEGHLTGTTARLSLPAR